MPFHRALCHNAWHQVFWTFRAYPNVQILAQAYPYQLRFAQNLLTDKETQGFYHKLTFISSKFFSIHSSPSTLSNFDSFETPILSEESSPFVSEDPSPSTPNPILTPNLSLVLPSFPKTSTSTSVPHSTGTDSNPLLQQILDQLSLRPTTSGLTELTCHLETQIQTHIEEASSSIHDRIDDIVGGANQLPKIIANELRIKLKDIVQTITAKDQVFLSEILKTKRAVEAMNENNLKTNSALIQQVFDLKDMIRQQNERSDNAMALVHQQQQAAEALQVQHRNDFSASQSQMQELLQAVQHLTDLYDDDNKGEKKGKAREAEQKQKKLKEPVRSEVRGSDNRRVFDTRSQHFRGRGQSSDRGRGRGSSSSSFLERPSRPANIEEDLRKWSEEIRIKEEQALLREEESLRKEEEERNKLLRRPRDRR